MQPVARTKEWLEHISLILLWLDDRRELVCSACFVMKNYERDLLIRDWDESDRTPATEVIRSVLTQYGLADSFHRDM